MRLSILAAAALCVSAVAAHADTFALFNINGVLNNGATVMGQINIDITQLGPNNVASLTYATSGVNPVSATFQGTNTGTGYSPYETELDFGDISLAFNLQFPTPYEGSFTGFTGGLCTSTSLCGSGRGTQSAVVVNGNVYIFVTGTATPASVTPEPGSFVLLATGLLGVAGVVRKRFA